MQRVREQVQVPEQIYSVTWRSEPVTVAVLDTGIAYHPDLAGHLLCFRDFVEKSSLPYDDNGHGTHVSGILGGDGTASQGRYKGAAPGCGIVALKVLDRFGNGSREDVLRAFQWIEDFGKIYNIRIVNVSVGSFSGRNMSENSALVRGVEEIWDAAGEFVNDNTLTVYIKRLREKIETDPQNPTIIRTVRGLGYKLE